MSTRTLVILRHAKAVHTYGVRDADRPLTPRGRADAAAAGGWLARRGYLADLVLCSPARRTRETWDGVRPALPTAPRVRFDDEMYLAPLAGLAQLITQVDDQHRTVLLIGHNPALSELSALLDPAGSEPDGLRTAGIAVHLLPGSWVECGAGAAPLTDAHVARG